VTREGMLPVPAAGDVSKLDRLLAMGLHVRDDQAQCPGAAAPGVRTSSVVIVVFGNSATADAARTSAQTSGKANAESGVLSCRST
jgi:hypothetical protein